MLRLLITGTPFCYTCQLLFLTPMNYLLLLTIKATPYCISYFYQLVLSVTIFRYCCIPNYYSHQLFLSSTSISYSYLLFSHTPVRYSYQNSFVINHSQLLISLTPVRYSYVITEQANNKIDFQLNYLH